VKIAVVHNARRAGVINQFGQPAQERYSATAICRVVSALEQGGHEVLLFEGDKTLLGALEAFMPPIEGRPGGLVMNLSLGIQGCSPYSHVPAMLEMAGVPYTGSSPMGHALALDKAMAKDLIRCAGVSTPHSAVMESGGHIPAGLRFPLVVKPRHRSTSFGPRLVRSEQELRNAAEAIVSTLQQDALVEEYVEGREFSVALFGNHPVRCLPIVELDVAQRELRLLTRDDQFHSDPEPKQIGLAGISRELAAWLCTVSIATFRACRCRDYARVDVRVDAAGQLWVLEIDTMPSLGPGDSYVRAAEAAGLDYDALVNRIVDVAHERYFGVPAPVRRRADAPAWRSGGPQAAHTSTAV
jgi:D-alanine-D-alanine ligase